MVQSGSVACPSVQTEPVEDIEDVILRGDANQIARLVSSPNVTLRVKKRRTPEHHLADIQLDSFVPGSCLFPRSNSYMSDFLSSGTHTVYVKTWGCSHNNSDSEYMAGILASSGYKIVTDHDATASVSTSDNLDSTQKVTNGSNNPHAHVKWTADVWLLNSCTVKNPAEDHFKNYIESGLNARKKVVLAGCVAQSAPNAEYMKSLSIVGVQQIDRVTEVIEESLKGNIVRLLGVRKEGKKKSGGASLSLPKVRRNPLIEIIAISTGEFLTCLIIRSYLRRSRLFESMYIL